VKILFIVTAYPRAPDDVITPWLVETIHRLKGRGIEVEVLAPSYRGIGEQNLKGTRVHRFRYAPALFETLTHDQTAPDRIRERPWYLALVPGYVLFGSLAAARLARRGQFDVVHAFWPLPHGLLGLAARRASGVPLVSTFFGVELTWLRSQLPLLSPVVRSIIRRSDAVTVISSHTASEVARVAPGTAVRTIPFGATVSVGDRGQRRRSERRTSAGVHRLLFVGRLVERKGVPHLLRALARLRDSHDVRLDVVGDGPQRSALQTLALELGLQGHVNFHGYVSEEVLARHFRECDVFVLPAITDAKGDVEGLGVVLIEAMLNRKPVVASRSGGITDIVRDGSTGLLVPPADVDALTSAIRRLLDDPQLADELAEAGAKDVATRFSWERILGDLESLYREVTARGSSASAAGRVAGGG
jgi:glycosyltransferase involved in cell wall biosynthesis